MKPLAIPVNSHLCHHLLSEIQLEEIFRYTVLLLPLWKKRYDLCWETVSALLQPLQENIPFSADVHVEHCMKEFQILFMSVI